MQLYLFIYCRTFLTISKVTLLWIVKPTPMVRVYITAMLTSVETPADRTIQYAAVVAC